MNSIVLIPKTDNPKPVLTILVEGMGRINFGQAVIDWMGITDRVTLNSMTQINRQVYSLPHHPSRESDCRNLHCWAG